MRTAALIFFLSVAYAGSTLEPAKPVAIWPHGAPGETTALDEHDTTTDKRPLIAGRRVIRLVRAHAKEWGVRQHRIGALGFSAGAHLAADLSNNYDKRTYDPIDEADQVSCRPDFAAIIYPGLITEKNEDEKLASEMTVT